MSNIVSMPSIKVTSLVKKYFDLPVINSINFEVNSGEIVGLVGPNGAGKTTILRILSTLLKPSSGKVFLNDLDSTLYPAEIRKNIGYMPEDGGLYLKYTGYMNLAFYASFYPNCNDADQLQRSIDKFLGYFDLLEHQNNEVGRYSKGMKQKLLFIRALMHDPQVILLDEPFNSMDPDARIKAKKVLFEEKNAGKAIIFSSHALTEVETLCDRVIILKDGFIIRNESISDLVHLSGHRKEISLEEIYAKVLE